MIAGLLSFVSMHILPTVPYISNKTDQENLSHNQEHFLELKICAFILMTFKWD